MDCSTTPGHRRRILPTLAMLYLAGAVASCGGGSGPSEFTVTATAATGGTISPASVTVTRGSTATFTLAPAEGFLVDQVSGCGGSLQGMTYVTGSVTSACAVSASFRRPIVSGMIFPAGGTAVDSDVNDPLAPYASNDDFSEAQLVPNPVTLGGYVNVPGAGPEGRSFAAGDEFDYFRVELLAGQVITLQIASADVSDDLDLYLIDLDQNIVDASVDDVSRVETLVVPPDAGDEYYLLVHAYSGASNYLLMIGQPFAAERTSMRLSDAFIPGQVIVRPEFKGGEPKFRWPAGVALPGQAGGRDQEIEPRNMLLDITGLKHSGAQVAALDDGLRAFEALAGAGGRLQLRDSSSAEKLETLMVVKALSHDPAIAAAIPNYLYELHASFTPNDRFYPLQWHYPQISLPSAWPLNTGSGAVVAVIDSGVYLEHPDLQGRQTAGYDFILGIPGGNDPGDSPLPPGGSSFHGTHVAGTIAALTDNQLGVAGVAFDARVMPLRVCDTRGCPFFAIEQALRYAAGLPNDSGTVPAEPAGVINLSLGRQGPAVAFEQALFNELRDRDIFVVASAGNSNTSSFNFPAAYDNVIAVSAVDLQGQKAHYSNFGAWIDVAAPGGDMRRDLNADGFPDGVLSTVGDDRSGTVSPAYAFFQGTSMAAPHVAGVAALIRSAVPGLTAQDIEHLLRNDAITDDLGAPGRDDIYGHGLINAHKAVTAALNTGGQPVELDPLMAASPPSVNFGTSLDTQVVTFTNVGGGALQFGTPDEDSGGWLGLAAAESDGRLVVTLSVQRDNLEEGVYAATLTVPSSANTVEVRVFMQVAEVLAAEVGLQYVLLVDPGTFATVSETTAVPVGDGRQRFRIEDVAAGSYLLFAGSDSDNDDFICDPGESCGIYRSPGEPVRIEVTDRDLDGLDFSSGYFLESPSAEAVPATGEGTPLDRRALPRVLPRTRTPD